LIVIANDSRVLLIRYFKIMNKTKIKGYKALLLHPNLDKKETNLMIVTRN